jgi:replicative DNA helicase
MEKEKVDALIRKLNNEIVKVQKGQEQEESLVRLKEIARVYRGEDKVIPFSDVKARIKTSADDFKIFTGWVEFDKLIKGFRLQQSIVVSALTKSGKTSFLMDMTERVQAYHPIWFSFEQSIDELISISLERGIEPPQAYTPESLLGNTVEWVESKIVESIAKYDTKIVFIDHLDFIVPLTGDNHHLMIAKTMRELKGIAKKWNILIFTVCHLQKAKMDSQPTLEDLRGSSSIGQEADTVILLWREMKKEHKQVVITNNVNVSVQANRRYGSTGNVKFVYDNGRFREQEWETEAEIALKEF